MRLSLSVATLAAALFGCHDATPSGPTDPALARGGEPAASAADKVAICHASGGTEDPKFHEISVASSAVVEHLADHGDYLPTPRTPCPPPPVVSNVRVCKAVATGMPVGRTFAFDVAGETITLAGGACADRTFRVGTNVTIRETVPDGTMLDAIAVAPTGAGTADVPSATATVVAGIDVAAVTFTNRALYGKLRICKAAAPPDFTLRRSFLFMLSTAPSTAKFYSVGSTPAGMCQFVDAFPVGTRVGIMEEVPFLPGAHVTGISVLPADRLVAGSVNLSEARVAVVIGTGETDVSYTNDRPVADVRLCVVGSGLTGTVRIAIFADYLDGPFGRDVPVNGCVDDFVESTGLLIGSRVIFGFPRGELPAGAQSATIGVQPSDLAVEPGYAPNSWRVQIGPTTTVTITLTQ